MRSAAASEVVGVSTMLDGYAEAAALLRGWGPVMPAAARSGGLAVWGSGLASLTLFALAWGNRGWPGTAAAATLFVGLAYCLWHMQRNPHLDARLRRTSWVVLLPMLSLGWRVLGPWLR